MGKYLKKPKLTSDIVAPLMDVSQLSSLGGVRTRAKTLALQKLQHSKTTDTSLTLHHHELSYLQLRSRKLEKPPLQHSSCCTPQNPNPNPTFVSCDFPSQDTYFAENNFDFDPTDRGTRESTPCSFIMESNDNITPGSTTRPTNRYASNRIMQNSMQRTMPSAQEIEEFFALHAQEQQRLFSEKYNFDIVSEKPLEGRYEWVRVQPKMEVDV